MRKFSDVISQLRKEKNLSQRALSEELGLSHSAIGMYEKGQREPNYEILEKIADYFNVDMNYLLGKTTIRNSYTNNVLTDRVLERLKKLNMSVNELCTKMCIDKENFYDNLQNASFNYTVSNIIELSLTLETTPEYLTGLTNNPDGFNFEIYNPKQEKTLRVIRRASNKMDNDKLDRMLIILKNAFPDELEEEDD